MHDDRAATAPLAFVIAGALIIGVIATAMMTTNDIATPSNTGASTAANRQAQAQGLVQILLETPGHRGNGDVWTITGPITKSDGSELGELGPGGRLGLRHADVPYLDLSKFRNLKSAPYEAKNDNFANYEETRASLGLAEEGLGFHIRAYPTLQSVQDRLNCIPKDACKDPNLRVTYIGNLKDPVVAPTLSAPKCMESPVSDKSWRFQATIKNTGITTTQFQGVFDMDFGTLSFERKDQTGLVAPGASTDIWVDVENRAGVKCDGATMTLHLYDTSRRLTHPAGHTFAAISKLSTPPQTASQEFYGELGRLNYAEGETIQVGFTGAAKDKWLDWTVSATSTGALVDCFLSPADCQGSHKMKNANDHIDIKGLMNGDYVLKVTHRDTGIVATQRILVESGTIDSYDDGGAEPEFDEAMRIEVDHLRQLVKNFCPAHYDEKASSVLQDDDPDAWSLSHWTAACGSFRPASIRDVNGVERGTQDGDVFWDVKSLMTDELCKRFQYVSAANGNCQKDNPPRLDITNVLVVGSNVDHSSMTSGGFKWPLQAWVEAGGTVIAFGSPETSTQWLQPIFHVGEQSSSGGISAPDTTHPILAVPNQLDYTSFDNQGKTWHYTGGAEEWFTNVVNQGDDPITAVNDPGTFGLGTVMISTWLPYSLFDGDTGMAGLAILDNFLTHAYRDMFLDYGPPIPAGQEVIPALGRSQICHTTNVDILSDPVRLRKCNDPNLDGLGLIDMDIALFVFRG